VIVTVVLLNVAFMCTTARLTLRRVFRFLALATGPLLPGLLAKLNQSASDRSAARTRFDRRFWLAGGR
jgi:hypothetical protein